MSSPYNVNVRRDLKAEEIEFPPLDETPLIEKISQPGYKAPIANQQTQQTQQVQSQEQESPFKVSNQVPDEIRAEYNKTTASYEEPEQQFEQPEVEEQQEYMEQVEEVEEKPVENTIANNKKKNQQSINESFRALRLKAEQAEEDNRKKDALLAQFMTNMQNQQYNKPSQQQEPDFNSMINSVDNDGLVDGNQFKRVANENKRYADKIAQDVAQYKQELEELKQENKIRAKYPDLEKVLTPENRLILSQRAPKTYAAWKNMPDSWDKVEAMYESIKSYGIDKAIEYKQEQGKIQTNMQKPRAVNSVVVTKKDSALSNVNNFVDEYSMSEEQRQAEFKEMMKNISRM